MPKVNQKKDLVKTPAKKPRKKPAYTAPATPLIFRQIPKVMADIEAIQKTRNSEGALKYKYRGIDDVYNSIHVAMAEHGVFTVPQVLEVKYEERKSRQNNLLLIRILTMLYTFYAEDGSHIRAKVIGEGMDTGDKGHNKAMAIAHKYALLQVFCIPTEDKKDPEADAHELAAESVEKKPLQQARSDKPAPQATTTQASQKPGPGEKVKYPKDIEFKLMDGTRIWVDKFDILGLFADMKKILGSAAYYKILKKYDVKKANEIKAPALFQTIYSDLAYALELAGDEAKMDGPIDPAEAASRAQKLILTLIDKYGVDPLEIPAKLRDKYDVSDLRSMDPDQAEAVLSFLGKAIETYEAINEKKEKAKKGAAALKKAREENKAAIEDQK